MLLRASILLPLYVVSAGASLLAGEPDLLHDQPRKHLAFDPRLIHTAQNARVMQGTPVKAAENPLFQADKPWENALNNLYPNVLWDQDAKVFKLWYKCVLADKDAIARMDGPSTVHDVGWYLLYATSKDGLRWEKPALGLHRFGGDSATNIVARDTPNVGVFKDAHDPDAARRYKMVYDVGLGKPRVRFSADGVHWSDAIEARGFGPQNGDTHNNAFWDPAGGRYLWFTKLYLGERTMARFESQDFIHWHNDGMVLRSTIDEGKTSQTYCMTPFRYGSVWLAYVMIYHAGGDRSVDCELAWSPDLLHWERLAPGTPFLPRGAKGSYDSECLYAMAGPPVIQDGQLLLFYGGSDFPHTGWKRHCLPCLARVPVDQFAGYAPQDMTRPATLFTRQIVVTDEPLRISASAGGGSIRIAAIDEIAVGIDEAEPITGDVTDQPLKWKHDGLSHHAGKRIHLQIELDHATLWAVNGVELTQTTLPPHLNPLKSPHRRVAPVASKTVSFDHDAEGWKGVDQLKHHATGGARGGHVSVSRSGRSLPIAYSPAGAVSSPLAGDWPRQFGGRGARIACQVRASKPGGTVQVELFAKDIAQWSFATSTSFGPDWRQATAILRYDWSDEEAEQAGWKRAANAFSWEDTIQHVGKVVVVPVAIGAQESFDLDEVTVSGE